MTVPGRGWGHRAARLLQGGPPLLFSLCAPDGASVCSDWMGLAEGYSLTSHLPLLSSLSPSLYSG